MAARSIWKGYLRLSLVNCSVALYPAVTRQTRCTSTSSTAKPATACACAWWTKRPARKSRAKQQVKGYQISKREIVEVEKEDLEKIALEATHVMEITKFVPREEIDPLYFDRPYYLAPTDDASQEAFAVIREAMRKKEIGGLATVIMHERDHVVLLEPREEGMLATILRSPEEVRDAKEVFREIEKSRVGRELLDVAQMLIEKRMGKFEPIRVQGSLRGRPENPAQGEEGRAQDQGNRAAGEARPNHQRAGSPARESQAGPRASAPRPRHAPRRAARPPTPGRARQRNAPRHSYFTGTTSSATAP